MDAPFARFHYDLADPLSYLTELELRAVEDEAPGRVERVPLELSAPPSPLLDAAGEAWAARLAEAAGPAERMGVELHAPRLLPWTRKAHELVLHARGLEMEREVTLALYEALLGEGRDIGRVDVLVELAVGLGLDLTETKAVLDVDRHAEDVAAGAASARAVGVDAPPALSGGGAVLRGFHNGDAIRTFLASIAHAG